MAEFDGHVEGAAEFGTVAAPLAASSEFAKSPLVATRRPGLRLDLIAKALILALCFTATANWLAHRPQAVPVGALAEHTFGKVHDGAEHAIYLGGILLERNRHTIAGGALGCTIGAALGAGTAAIAGVFTAGAGFAAIPSASMAGCALAGLGGIALGYPLDDYLTF